MNMKSKTNNAANVANPYPHGRWTRPLASLPTDLAETSLRTLFWNVSESGMVRETSQRIESILEAAAIVPPFLTGMDCPMPEAA